MIKITYINCLNPGRGFMYYLIWNKRVMYNFCRLNVAYTYLTYMCMYMCHGSLFLGSIRYYWKAWPLRALNTHLKYLSCLILWIRLANFGVFLSIGVTKKVFSFSGFNCHCEPLDICKTIVMQMGRFTTSRPAVIKVDFERNDTRDLRTYLILL